MMRSGRFLAMAAAAVLTAAPVMAAPVNPSPVNPAASLSVSDSLRTGSKTKHDSQFTFLLGIVIFVAVSVGAAGAAGAFSDSK